MSAQLKNQLRRFVAIAPLAMVGIAMTPGVGVAQTVCIPALGLLNCSVGGSTLGAPITSTPLPLTVLVASPSAITGPIVASTLGSLTLTSSTDILTNLANQPALTLVTPGAITATTQNLTTAGVSSTGTLLNAGGAAALTVNGALQTAGANADGIDATAASLNVAANTIKTVGAGANGTNLVSTAGGAGLSANAINTSGDLADGTLIHAAGPINVNLSTIQTGGLNALGLSLTSDPAACAALGSGTCSINAVVGNLTTNGPGAIGALVNAAGPTNLKVDALQTNGGSAAGLNLTTNPAVCAVVGSGSCGSAFNLGQLITSGNMSPGVLATIAGPTTGNVTLLQTNGQNSPGLVVTGDPVACVNLGRGACNVSETVGQLLTTGAGSGGVLVNSPAQIKGNFGQIATQGDNSPGINLKTDPAACLVLGVGACGVNLVDNSVKTGGQNSGGIGIVAAGPVTLNTQQVTTNGINSPGVLVATDPTACAVLGAGACATNIGAGTVQTGGDGSQGIGVVGAVPVAINTTKVTTAGANAPAISVSTTPAVCAILGVGSCGTGIKGGNLQTGGPNSSGVGVTGAGPTQVAVGTITTSGVTSPGINIATDPATCVILGAGSCANQVTANTITTAGDGSPGVGISGAGPTSVAVMSVKTAGSNSPDIGISLLPSACAVIGSGNCGVSVAGGSLVTGGNGSPGVGVLTSGPVSIITGPIQTSGANATGINAVTDPAACLVIGSGLCPTVVNAMGPITTAGNSSGGVLVSAAGPINVVTGPVKTAGTNAPGVGVILNPTVCATLGAAACSGTLTAGPIITTGSGSPGVMLTGGGGGGNVLITAAGVMSNGPGILANTGCTNVSINATGPINASAGAAISAVSACSLKVTTQPGAPITGATGGIVVASGTTATIVNGDVTSAANNQAITASGTTINLTNGPAGTIVGAITLAGAGDTFTNNGVFKASGPSTFGDGTATFNNAGTILVNPGAAAPATVNFGGVASLNNSGLIDLRNGQVGDQLTIAGPYVGSGGATLGVDVGPNSTADRLVTGAATGQTTVLATGLSGGLVNNAVIVSAAPGSNSNAFRLAGGVQQVGLTDYTIMFNPTLNQFAVFGTPDVGAVAPITLIDGARQIFYRGDDAVDDHLDEGRIDRAVWLQAFGSEDSRELILHNAPFGVSREYDLSSSQYFAGLQGGVDLIGGPNGSAAGATVGYIYSRDSLLATTGRFDFNAINGGVYGRFETGPLRLDGLAKYEHVSVNYTTGGFGGHTSGEGYGGRISATLVAASGSLSVLPFAIVDYEHLNLGATSFAGYTGTFSGGDGFRGKAGVRLEHAVSWTDYQARFYTSGAVVHDFAGQRDGLNLANSGYSVGFQSPQQLTYGQVRLGMDMVHGGTRAYVELIGDLSQAYSGGGGRAGIAIGF